MADSYWMNRKNELFLRRFRKIKSPFYPVCCPEWTVGIDRMRGGIYHHHHYFMKLYTKTKLSRMLGLLFLLTLPFQPVRADGNDQKHELENMHVTIDAADYKTAKFIEKETVKGKEYIKGKASSYNKRGEANAKTLLQPCAEYAIKSKLPGGTYNVTVFYAIDKDKAPEVPMISIGINTQQAQHIEIKDKLINSVRASFKVNFFKGKQHTVKVWFPSEGVKVREVRIAKALLPKKKDKE